MSAIGRLRARITLQRPSAAADMTAPAWLDAGEVWAEIAERETEENGATDARAARARYIIVIRAHPEIAPGWRVQCEGRTFRIRTVSGAGVLVTLACEEEFS